MGCQIRLPFSGQRQYNKIKSMISPLADGTSSVVRLCECQSAREGTSMVLVGESGYNGRETQKVGWASKRGWGAVGGEGMLLPEDLVPQTMVKSHDAKSPFFVVWPLSRTSEWHFQAKRNVLSRLFFFFCL